MLDEKLNEFKANAFYAIKSYLNCDFSELNKFDFEEEDEPFLDEEEEEYIALVLDQLMTRVKYAVLIAHNETLIEVEKQEAERAKQFLEKLGYTRKQIEDRLKD